MEDLTPAFSSFSHTVGSPDPWQCFATGHNARQATEHPSASSSSRCFLLFQIQPSFSMISDGILVDLWVSRGEFLDRSFSMPSSKFEDNIFSLFKGEVMNALAYVVPWDIGAIDGNHHGVYDFKKLESGERQSPVGQVLAGQGGGRGPCGVLARVCGEQGKDGAAPVFEDC